MYIAIFICRPGSRVYIATFALKMAVVYIANFICRRVSSVYSHFRLKKAAVCIAIFICRPDRHYLLKNTATANFCINRIKLI